MTENAPTAPAPAPTPADPAPTAAPAAQEGKSPQKEAQPTSSLLGDVSDAADMVRPEGLPDKYWDEQNGKPKWGDVLKQHNYLEEHAGKIAQKAGEYFGPPDKDTPYEVHAPKGTELQEGDPMVAAWQDKARQMGLSQKAFDETIAWYAEFAAEHGQDEKQRVAQELTALGANATQRLSNINDWAKAQCPPEFSAGLKDAATTAEGVKFVEWALSQFTGQSALPSFDGQGAPSLSREEVEKERFKKDDNGRVLYDTSPDHRKRVKEMYQQLEGKGTTRKRMG